MHTYVAPKEGLIQTGYAFFQDSKTLWGKLSQLHNKEGLEARYRIMEGNRVNIHQIELANDTSNFTTLSFHTEKTEESK